jgi:hypothetical protein
MTRPSGGGRSYTLRIRSFFTMKFGSVEPFQVLVACQEIPAAFNTCRTVSWLTVMCWYSAR